MSYPERRAVVSFLSSLLITGAYSVYMRQHYPDAEAYSAETFQFWGQFFLLLIAVTIVAKIIIQIVFYILNTIITQEEENDKLDERDRLIEFKSDRNALYTFSIGFLLAMIAVAAGMSPEAMFVLLLGGGLASELVSQASQFYFYRRGF
jgi:hypothetical protein